MLPQVINTGISNTYSPKDPNDSDEFIIDFTQILAEYNDSLTGMPTIVSSPSGLGIFNISQTSGGLLSFYASGGVNNTLYEIYASVSTNLSPSGRSINRSVLLPVANR